MKTLQIIVRAFLVLIGLVSLFMTFSIVFDLFDIREKEGNFVYPIVYANMVCGFLYLIAAFYFSKQPKLSVLSLATALLILLIAFAWFFVHIQSGGIYETKTVKAMSFRTAFTFVTFWVALKKSRDRI